MSKSKPFNFIIPLVVYPFDIMVSIGETDADICRTLAKNGVSLPDQELILFASSTTKGRTAMFSTNQTCIRLQRHPKSCIDYGILQHEIFHAASFILDRIGMTLHIGHSDEAYAYLIGYITTEIYKRI